MRRPLSVRLRSVGTASRGASHAGADFRSLSGLSSIPSCPASSAAWIHRVGFVHSPAGGHLRCRCSAAAENHVAEHARAMLRPEHTLHFLMHEAGWMRPMVILCLTCFFGVFLFLFLSFQGRTRGIWRFPGQRSHPSCSHSHSHSHTRSEPRRQPTPQLTATPDP